MCFNAEGAHVLSVIIVYLRPAESDTMQIFVRASLWHL